MRLGNSHHGIHSPDFRLYPGLYEPPGAPRAKKERHADTGLDAQEYPYRPPEPRSGTEAIAWDFASDGALGADTADILAAEAEALARNAERRLYLAFKRVMDLCGAAFALVLLSPLMLLVAILIKLSDRGPVFYIHRRVGERGREFTCYKFRTMVMNADQLQDQMRHMNAHQDHRTFKMACDPRVTRIGRWLRKTSFDEVPQFWNVLRGEMSLVGPRPPVPAEVEQYSPRDTMRLEVKPGLTCIWQVSGRSRLSFPQQLELDIEYIRKRGLWFDLKLIALTIPAVLRADGAY